MTTTTDIGGEVMKTVTTDIEAAKAAIEEAVRIARETKATRSYNGRAHVCCCGCAGNYSENAASITRTRNAIIKRIETGCTFYTGDNHIAADNEEGTRVAILYFD